MQDSALGRAPNTDRPSSGTSMTTRSEPIHLEALRRDSPRHEDRGPELLMNDRDRIGHRSYLELDRRKGCATRLTADEVRRPNRPNDRPGTDRHREEHR